MVNQDDLFGEKIVSLDEVAGRLRELYAWLTFGVSRKGELEHLCWAMPPADEGDWLAHIDIKGRRGSASSPSPSPAPVDPPAPVKLRFKEHIEEQLTTEKKKEDDKK